MSSPPLVCHNLRPPPFVWLWSKYVRGTNDAQHCTASLRGTYSRKLTRLNPALASEPAILMDEQPAGSYSAIYLCGVARAGYAKKLNYPHNLHAAIRPEPGGGDTFRFENWRLSVENGVFVPIPSEDQLPDRYRALPPEFTTCRIFRFAVCNQDWLSAG